MGSIDTTTTIAASSAQSHYDVLIVGAGISGINSAYRIHTELPDYKYAIIESRDALGGTWDLFRYPGIRSDSDLHTFGFPWRPWSDPQSIADGHAIRDYIQDSAEEYGIDKHVLFQHRLTAADWSSDEQQWTLSVDAAGTSKTVTARFVVFSTGYYDYKTPLQTQIPGLENFKGHTLHPQFWDEDVDYADKKAVIIGSGATAITLLPALAKKAARVTMLQRSPTYVISQPRADPFASFIHKILPTWLAFKLVRWKFLILPFLFYKFCRAYPRAARWALRRRAQADLPKSFSYDPHFTPRYNPWEQRLCVCPDGDFFKVLGEGVAEIVTDRIKTVTATGILTESGRTLDADIIITATGLNVQLMGGVPITVDSKPVNIADKFVWKGQMFQDVPNAVLVLGYVNASWTLGSDSTAIQVCRLLKHMDRNGMAYATARLPKGKPMVHKPIMDLSSTYMERAKSILPRVGNEGPWKPRTNYLVDQWEATHGSLTTDMEFTKVMKDM